MLTDKQHEVIDYYYNDDLSLSEIADNQGITRQGVHDSIKRAESQLLDMEERLGLARRFRKMRIGFEQISSAATKIKEYNDHFIYSNELEDNAKIILELSQKLCE